MSTLAVTIIVLIGCFFIGMPIFMSLIIAAVEPSPPAAICPCPSSTTPCSTG